MSRTNNILETIREIGTLQGHFMIQGPFNSIGRPSADDFPRLKAIRGQLMTEALDPALRMSDAPRINGLLEEYKVMLVAELSLLGVLDHRMRHGD